MKVWGKRPNQVRKS